MVSTLWVFILSYFKNHHVDPTLFPTLQREVVTLLNYLTACLHSYLLTEIPGWGPRLLGTTLCSAVQCRSMHAHVVTLWLACLSVWCYGEGTAGLSYQKLDTIICSNNWIFIKYFLPCRNNICSVLLQWSQTKLSWPKWSILPDWFHTIAHKHSAILFSAYTNPVKMLSVIFGLLSFGMKINYYVINFLFFYWFNNVFFLIMANFDQLCPKFPQGNFCLTYLLNHSSILASWCFMSFGAS